MSSPGDFESTSQQEHDDDGGGGFGPSGGGVYRSLSYQPPPGEEMYEEGEPANFNFVVQQAGQGAFDPLDEPPVYRSLAVSSSMAQPNFFEPTMAQPITSKSSLTKPSLTKPSLTKPSLRAPDLKPALILGDIDYSTIAPKPVPEFFPLEQTHFFVRGSPDAIAQTVSDEIGKAGANFEFKLEKCKWKGTIDDNGGRMLDFRIKLFETDARGVYLIESQRRSGSGHHLLLKMHTMLHNQFASMKYLCNKSGTVIDRVLPAVRDVYQVMKMREIPAGMVPVC